MDGLVRSSRCCILVFVAWLVAAVAQAESLTTEARQAVRAATFEVVLPKADSDTLSYEKPLPLDLIPYIIRNDHYWSIGTAFAIGPNTYVSAGHVLLGATGSQYGTPALRDDAGHVYLVDKILKFSAHEDFIVFTVAGAPDARPLQTITERKIDDSVFAVGNALGEGIVIRDGLLTSETPEEQDGRWKWLRFSAAASPGNSGGPLLDKSGRVIGIVERKSPNENLNFALPIANVLDAPEQARFDIRYTTKLPTVRESQVATLKTQFTLPRSFAEFSRAYQALTLSTTQRDQQQLLTSLAGQIFPNGKSAKLLATVYEATLPAFVQQDSDDVWDAIGPSDVADHDLPGRGLVSTGNALGVQVFRLRRPNAATDDKFYHDPVQFMDLLLKGLKIPRIVGTEQIRITSLGHPSEEHLMEDHYGRRWQVSRWPLGFTDSYVICYALPTPEGYVGIVHIVPASQAEITNEHVKLLADAVYVNYSGNLAQWQAFLARAELRPKSFDHIQLKLDDKQGLSYQSPRLELHAPRDLGDLSPSSELDLLMTYILTGKQLNWDVGAAYFYKDTKRNTYFGLQRHVRPADESAEDLLDTWNTMRSHGPGFNSVAGHDSDFRSYWIHDAISALTTGPGIDPAATVLYDVSYTTDAGDYPVDLEESERRLIRATRVLER
jgi:serine protease Do